MTTAHHGTIALAGAGEFLPPMLPVDKYLVERLIETPRVAIVPTAKKNVPKPTIALVAERLNVYPSQIFGVLTFYAQFHLKPRGRYIIRVCVGTACHVQGATRIVETFFDKLHIGHAETSSDLRYTFEKVACLGACGMAPLAMVNDATYGSMTVQKVEAIIADYNQRPMK